MSKGKIIGKSIKEMIDEIRKTRGAYEAKRLERAADEVPNLERLYKRDALERLFQGDNARGIMTMRPGDFERYASPLIKNSEQEKHLQYLSGIKGFEDVPFLEVKKLEDKRPKIAISGHEGRHRSRVLDAAGEQASLVQFYPRASLREDFPRRHRDEYIDALREELERHDRMVTPEPEVTAEGLIVRPAIELPDVYAGGGPVHKADGGSIKASPTKPGHEFLGRLGQVAERLGIKLEEAMKIVSQEGNSPIKAFLVNLMGSETLKSAGTALQDWTGTPRDATEDYPYRRLMTGKGMTAQFDPRMLDVAPIAGSAASRVTHGIKHLPTDVMRAAVAAYGPQATASRIKPNIVGGLESGLSNKKIDSVRAEREAAFERARINAAKMLGLPENNTAMDRAIAMSYEPDMEMYHGSLHDIKKVNLDKGETGAFAGQGFYTTPSPEDASINYASITGPDVLGKIERGIEYTDKDLRRIQKAFSEGTISPTRAETVLREIGVGDNLGVVYPLMVKRGAEANMVNPRRSALIDAGEYYDEATDSYIEGPMAQAWRDVMKTFEDYGVEPPEEIYELMSTGGSLDDVWNAVANSRGSINIYDPYTGDPLTKQGFATQIVKELGANTITHPTEFRNPQLNIAGEHTIAVQPTGIVRSRFAAFDPAEADSPDLLKKKGGQVSLDAMKLAVGGMAGGGIRKGLTRSIEDATKLFEAAQKTRSKAAQEAAGLYHPIGGGVKLSKPVELMTEKTVADPTVKPVQRKIITPEQMQGGVAIPLIGDRAAAARILQEIEGKKLRKPVKLQGGPGFMQTHTFEDAPESGAAWASGQGVITRLGGLARKASELAGTEKVYAPYVAMSPTGVDFNTMVADALLGQYDPSALTKKAKKEFLRDIRNYAPDAQKPHLKPGSVLTEADLNDVDALRAKMLTPDAGPLRKAFIERMGIKDFQDKGFPDVAATRKAITEPELLHEDVGSTGFNIARIDPEGRIVEEPRIPHATYPVQLRGEYFGSLEEPIPYSEFFSGFTESQRLKGKPEKHDWYTFGRSMPIQQLDQEWLDRLMKSQQKPREWKKGGPVKKAAGGALSIPQKLMREFVESGKKAKLTEQAKQSVTKGDLFMSDEETRRMQRELLQGVKKPEELADGGQITSDDLILEERPL